MRANVMSRARSSRPSIGRFLPDFSHLDRRLPPRRRSTFPAESYSPQNDHAVLRHHHELSHARAATHVAPSSSEAHTIWLARLANGHHVPHAWPLAMQPMRASTSTTGAGGLTPLSSPAFPMSFDPDNPATGTLHSPLLVLWWRSGPDWLTTNGLVDCPHEATLYARDRY
jgi:hypothetical protein